MSTPRRFRPTGWDALEERVVLSAIGLREPLQRPALRSWHQAAAANRPDPSQRFQLLQQQRLLMAQAQQRALLAQQQPRRAFQAPSARLHQTPEVVIDQQYAAFAAEIGAAIATYEQNLELGATQSQPVSLTLFSPYNPGDTVLDVGNLDFPPPTPEAPLTLSAILPDGTAKGFSATGGGGSLLTGVSFLGPGEDVPLFPGTELEARIPFDQAVVADIANQYFNFVNQRTLTLSSDLVTYFNRLPIRLPRLPGPYFTPRPETAIQFFLTSQIAGQEPQILLSQLLAQPLPSSTGDAVDFYNASISTIIENSRQQVRESVRLLFAGKGLGDILPVYPGQT